MSATPRVSIVMPVYNAGASLRDAVESILSQTYTDWELVAVDDGSTDGSGAILDDYAARNSRVRVVHQENRKQVAAMNRALAEARGEYVARMDADDRSYPERLARQVAFLDAHPDVGVLGTLADVSFANREEVWGSDPGHTLLRWRLLSNTPFVHPSVMMRTDIVHASGGYAPAAERLEDYDLFYRLSTRTRLATLPEKLVWYNRTGEDNISTVHFAAQQAVARRLHAEIAAAHGLAPSETVLDDYTRFAFVGDAAMDVPGWTPERLAGVAQLLWHITTRFVAETAPTSDEKNTIWGRTQSALAGLARRHAQASGRHRTSRLVRVGWAPRLALWSLSGGRLSP